MYRPTCRAQVELERFVCDEGEARPKSPSGKRSMTFPWCERTGLCRERQRVGQVQLNVDGVTAEWLSLLYSLWRTGCRMHVCTRDRPRNEFTCSHLRTWRPRDGRPGCWITTLQGMEIFQQKFWRFSRYVVWLWIERFVGFRMQKISVVIGLLLILTM